MKNYNKYVACALFAGVLTGCADTDIDNVTVEKPESIAQYEYLNQFGPLKSYVDRAAHPGFKLGTAASVDDYLKLGVVYRLTNSNFDQMTAGNAMKYASIVNDKGVMDFSKVSKFVETAEAAGLEIYGHTLCWHEQQNVKWLNSLIADKEIESDPNEKVEVEDYAMDYSTASGYNFWAPDEVKANISINKAEGCFELVNPAMTDQNYMVQYHIADGLPLAKGNDYILKVVARGSGEGKIEGRIGDWGGGAAFTINFDNEWKEYTVKFTSSTDGGFVLMQSGHFVGTIQIKSVKLFHAESPAVKIPVAVWEDDFSETTEVMGWGNNSTRQVVNGVLEVTNPSKANSWEAQFGKEFSTPLEVDTKYFCKLKIKGSVAGSLSAALQNPDGYKGCGDFSNIAVTTDWKEVTIATTCNGENALRFLINVGDYVGTIYIDEISFYYEKSANSIPLTPEQKCEVLTAEMERWVKGMMEATQGKVKAWDVVNEAISGGPWNQRYDLQHAATASGDQSNKFYWQDYLGDDFVRVPVKFARQYFEENGGNPDELKLFINDYNLESDWDDNQKLKSLIQWIEQWESDGVTKIDGIGSQMHISYYMDPITQAKKEEHVVKMLQLMANTGKLVRLTELDMGICDENGNKIKTEDVTFEQHKLMADYYKFIVQKYFEIVPVDQQYGICAWCQTDSPEGSGWRPSEPVGLWDLNYNRKPAFGGFADGLAGK